MALRERFGVPRSEVQGKAKYTRINSREPKVGAVIVFPGLSSLGHVGLVLRVEGNQVIYFDSNGDWKFRGAIRTININDRRIGGYRIINV
jgi:hypothetical protein